jgi:hypothetical protein
VSPTSPLPGVHAGSGMPGKGMTSNLGGFANQLKAIYGWLDKIALKASQVVNQTKSLHFGGTPGVGSSGSPLMPSTGSGFSTPLPGSGGAMGGTPGSGTNVGGMAMGNFKTPKWMYGLMAGQGLAMGALGAAGVAFAAMPSTEEAMTMNASLHQMGTRQNIYNGRSTQTQLLNNIMGSIDTYAVGGRDEPMFAALSLSNAGIQNQSMMKTLLQQNQGLSMMTQLPNSAVAAAQAGLSSGPFAARALTFGIPVSNIGTGNMKSTGTILETMYNRMMVTGSKATPENVQESFLRGSVGANFRAMGMTEEQQQIALQYFTERARTGKPVNLSNVKGLEAMGYNEENNTKMSEWSKDRSRLEVMNKTFMDISDGAKAANHALKGFYDWVAKLPPAMLKATALSKGFLDTITGDPAAAAGISLLTGALSGLMGLLSMLAGSRILKGLLGGGKGGLPGSGVAPKTTLKSAEPKNLLPKNGKTTPFRWAPSMPKIKLGGSILSSIALSVGASFLPDWITGGDDPMANGSADLSKYSDEQLRSQGMSADDIRLVRAAQSTTRSQSSSPDSGGGNWVSGAWNAVKSIFTGGSSPVGNQYSHSDSYLASGSNWSNKHRGIDFSAPQGAPVYAAASGRVVSLGSDTGWAGSEAVKIKGDGGYYFVYGHLSSNTVSKGDTVRAGQKIGKVGSLGNSTGPHLHFEVRNGPNYGSDVDPVPFIKGKAPKGAMPGGASGASVVQYAKKFIGVPYVAGGRSPKGWDCAGFTWYVYKHFGVDIGQVSEAQLKRGSKVNGVKNAKPGDLFIWRRKGTRGVGADGHVAIYVGGGRVIHSHGGTGGTTNITSLSAAVPSSHYLAGIRRVAGGGASLASEIGKGTPEAQGTTSSGAVAGSLVDISVSTAGMSVTTSSIADLVASGSSGASAGSGSVGPGNGVVSGPAQTEKGVGTGSPVKGKSNQAKIWNTLVGIGLDNEAAAGVLGNLQQESGFNPKASNGSHFGIAQWDSTRWSRFEKMAKKNNWGSVNTVDAQARYLAWEIKSKTGGTSVGHLNAAKTAKEAAGVFESEFERSGGSAMSNRYKYAREALQQFGKGGYSRGAYNVANDEDARIHAGEMILTASQAAEVRKATAGVITGQRGGGHTFNIYTAKGTVEEQAQQIARRVAQILDQESTTKTLMEV